MGLLYDCHQDFVNTPIVNSFLLPLVTQRNTADEKALRYLQEMEMKISIPLKESHLIFRDVEINRKGVRENVFCRWGEKLLWGSERVGKCCRVVYCYGYWTRHQCNSRRLLGSCCTAIDIMWAMWLVVVGSCILACYFLFFAGIRGHYVSGWVPGLLLGLIIALLEIIGKV